MPPTRRPPLHPRALLQLQLKPYIPVTDWSFGALAVTGTPDRSFGALAGVACRCGLCSLIKVGALLPVTSVRALRPALCAGTAPEVLPVRALLPTLRAGTAPEVDPERVAESVPRLGRGMPESRPVAPWIARREPPYVRLGF